MSFREASRVERLEADVFEAHIPDQWQQGKGAFGGLILGAMARAACAFEPDAARSLRTFSADIAGPVLVGPARIQVRALRRGQSQTNLQLDLEQQGDVLASALCTLSAPRRVELAPARPAPPAAATTDWRAIEPLPLAAPMGPVFAQHYEYRCVDPLPFSRAKTAESNAFLRERQGSGELDTPALLALLDAPWPALFATVDRAYAMGTVSFSAQFLPGAPIPAERALYSPGRMHLSHEGYCFDVRELWDGDRLVALSQQTIAALR